MFITISLIMLVLIIGSLFYSNHMREKSHQYRYQLVNQLRQLIYHVRQHRGITHAHLTAEPYSISALKREGEAIAEILNNLRLSAGVDTGREVRVLHDKAQSVLLNWPDFNVAKNQFEHGKLIRQMMFLTDEVMITWLIDTHNDRIATEYHQQWQKILDTLETLTRFRISIQDIDNEVGKQRLRKNAILLAKRMNQLSLICPLTMADNDQHGFIQTLKNWERTEEVQESQKALYQLSLQASYLIFTIYDQVLSDTCEQIYMPLEMIVLGEKASI
ncbi:MAG: hypothetical protein ACK5NC_07210 [Vibrio sp.]